MHISGSSLAFTNTREGLETNLCFVGLTGMIDPVRPGVKAAIEQCNQSGITAIMMI